VPSIPCRNWVLLFFITKGTYHCFFVRDKLSKFMSFIKHTHHIKMIESLKYQLASCPQCIIQSQRPIFSTRVHCLLQNMFDLAIRNFHLSTCLLVIRGGNLMCDEILLHQLLKNSVVKVLTSITYDCSRCTKMSKDSVFQKLDHNSVVIVLAYNNLHPFGHIVHSNQNIQIAKGV
jgi:hypothetical protein